MKKLLIISGLIILSHTTFSQNVGVGTNLPVEKLHVVGNVKADTAKMTDIQITNNPGAGKVLTSDANGVGTWQTAPIPPSDINGTTNYLIKFTGATTGSNSQILDNGTTLAIGAAPNAIDYLFVNKQQLTAVGDGQSTIHGYRTRDSQNDGINYGVFGTNTAIKGYNYWGDVYSFGVAGFSYNDYNRTGGILGAYYSGSYWGSLGYRSSGLIGYGVYGSGAYASGTGKLPNGNVNGIGGGFFGTIGSVSKGSAIGQLNEGELFASYNKGDVYTSGKQVELVKNNNKITPMYSVTSTDVNVYKKGKIKLVNGSAFVSFDENFMSLLADAPVVTVTPMGNCQGVYINSVSKEGFEIKELNNGTSTVEVSWIAVGDRIDGNLEVPQMLMTNTFDENLSDALFNDGNKKQSGKSMWWNGKELEFGTMPASLNPPVDINKKRDIENQMKANK